MKKGLFGAFGLSLAAIIGMQATAAYSAEKAADFSWSNVSMGGGGFVSAVIASPVDKGLFYARTDVGGAYRWNESTARWESMMDWVDVSERGLLGIEAIAVDPQESGVVYMVAGTSYWNNGRTAFLRSSDKGESWDVLYTWDEDGTKGAKVARFGAHGNGMGRGNGEALAVDPNDSKIMFYGSKNKGLWKSTDNGTSWSHVDAWTKAAGSDTTWNGSGFSFVQYAPGSSKVLYAGFLREGTTAKGSFENVFTSTDGGASWKALPIPDALRSTAGGSIVRLMPQRAVISGDGSKMTVTFADGAGPHSMMWDEGWGMIYDGFGRGAVLQLDVASATWSDVSPENFLDEGGDAKYDKVDVKGMVDCEAAGGTGKTCEEYYPYIAPYGGIAINPKNANEMVVTTEGYRGPQFWYTATSDTSGKWSDQWGTNIYHTTDGGKTWIASFKYYWMEGGVYPTTKQMDANGIGWMHNGSIHWSGSVAMDPFDNNRVFVTSGNGIFRCDNLSDYVYKEAENSWEEPQLTMNQVWHFSAHGVEETVPFEVVSIPGGPMISIIGDYDGFRHDDIAKYPAFRHKTNVGGDYVSLGTTQGLAYAPKSGKLAKVADKRAYEGLYNAIPIAPVQYSLDSGKTWTVETYTGPDEKAAKGTVALSAKGTYTIWVPMEGTTDVYRNYNGTTWEKVSGIDNSAFVVGDPENDEVFYAYTKADGKFYKSSDAGASFKAVSTPGESAFKKFRAIPGFEGDLWLPVAIQDPSNGTPASGKLLHSTDGGATWAAVEGVGYCEAVGFGAPKEKGGYPAIYVFATVGKVTGVFGSDDKGKTWTRVNDDGHEYGGLANGEFVMGDMNTYGVVYMSTAGRGIAARVPSTWKMGSSSSDGSTKVVPKANVVSNASVAYAHGNLELTLNASSARVSVFDMNGKKLFSRYYSNSASVPLKELVKAKGSYFVRVDNGKKVLFANRVIVTR